MNGVEILNTIEYLDFKIYWVIPIIFLGCALASILSDSIKLTLAFCVATALSIFACTLALRGEPKLVYYDVTISEDTKLEEFMEKYEILDINGKIYRVKERAQ